jgi:hypothetical protein
MTQCQHGFTRGRSCLANLLEIFATWTRLLDAGYGLDVIFLDYRKAFDSVSHQRLILKLRNIGIDGLLLNWIEAFLNNLRIELL